METNQLKLYSINTTAKVLFLGRYTVKKLIDDGKLGYLEMRKRKKIPYQEIVQFQTENIKRSPINSRGQLMSKIEIDRFLIE